MVIASPRVLRDATGSVPRCRVGLVVVLRDHDSASRLGDDGGWLQPPGGLASHVAHGARHPVLDPAGERVGVRGRTEIADTHALEAETMGPRPYERRLPLRAHRCMTVRRQVTKRMTSSTLGTADSSPYAVYMRHCIYSVGGMGRKGGWRYQCRARNAQTVRMRSVPSRGRTSERATRTAARRSQPQRRSEAGT